MALTTSCLSNHSKPPLVCFLQAGSVFPAPLPGVIHLAWLVVVGGDADACVTAESSLPPHRVYLRLKYAPVARGYL